ncbi:MAG: ABC transporter substrate-binding protein [Anaerolineae bacterium]|nr:ABC transporter substrate-binding protein [Anaerolineae bacterium]
MKKNVVLIIAAMLVLTACCPQTNRIRLPMGFVANVQFAPVYVAVEKGYFAAEGIELDFDYSWETNGVQLVGAGELPFAIASGDQVLLAREQGLPVLTFVNWWRRFPVAVIALDESGITGPADLAGHKVGIPETFGASYIGWRALAEAVGLKEGDVTLEPIGYTQLANLTEERVDAAVVYANNEPVQLAQMGYEFIQFSVADHATLVSNGIITNEKTLQENPELVQAFARAFLKGLEDTLADPDAAFDICRKYVEGLDENEATQRAVLEASLQYWQGDPLGASDPDAWQATADVMLGAGLLSTAVDAEQAFTNDFLP